MPPPTRRTRIAALLALAAFTLAAAAPGADPPQPEPPAAAEAEEIVEEDVSFRSGDRTIGATVIAPAGEGADRPGVVLVAGSGEGIPREVYRPQAEAFARAGIVALVYDKRGPAEGYSMVEASITDLADDAIAGVQLLRARPDTDPDLVGVHGHSEGGWTVVEAGARSADVAFVVAAAPGALPPDRTQVWMNKTQLRHAGVAESLLGPLGENLTRHVVGADAFRLAGHDPLPTLERLDQPFLAVIAEYDRSTPPGETLELYRETLERGGHPHYTLRVIDGVGHGLEASPDGFVEAEADLDSLFGDLAPEYVQAVTRWVHGMADGPPEPSADPAPGQHHESSPLVPAAPSALGVQLAALAVMLLAFASYPATAAIARLRGRRDPVPGRWSARTLVAAGLAVPPLAAGYLGYIMITAGTLPGPVAAGRPVMWLVLQLAALAAAAAAAVLIARWWRGRRQTTAWTNARLAALAAGAAAFLPWAAYWGLFTV